MSKTWNSFSEVENNNISKWRVRKVQNVEPHIQRQYNSIQKCWNFSFSKIIMIKKFCVKRTVAFFGENNFESEGKNKGSKEITYFHCIIFFWIFYSSLQQIIGRRKYFWKLKMQKRYKACEIQSSLCRK